MPNTRPMVTAITIPVEDKREAWPISHRHILVLVSKLKLKTRDRNSYLSDGYLSVLSFILSRLFLSQFIT